MIARRAEQAAQEGVDPLPGVVLREASHIVALFLTPAGLVIPLENQIDAPPAPGGAHHAIVEARQLRLRPRVQTSVSLKILNSARQRHLAIERV